MIPVRLASLLATKPPWKACKRLLSRITRNFSQIRDIHSLLRIFFDCETGRFFCPNTALGPLSIDFHLDRVKFVKPGPTLTLLWAWIRVLSERLLTDTIDVGLEADFAHWCATILGVTGLSEISLALWLEQICHRIVVNLKEGALNTTSSFLPQIMGPLKPFKHLCDDSLDKSWVVINFTSRDNRGAMNYLTARPFYIWWIFLLRDNTLDQLDFYWLDFLPDWSWRFHILYCLLLKRFRVAWLLPWMVDDFTIHFIFTRASTHDVRRTISRIPKQVRIFDVTYLRLPVLWLELSLFERRALSLLDHTSTVLECGLVVLLRPTLHSEGLSSAGRPIHENIAVLAIEEGIG